MATAEYLGGAPATIATSDRQVVPEFLPQDWLHGTRAMRQGVLEDFLHRSLDIVACLALLGLTLPLLLIVALAIKLDSPGPIFYRQERVGRNNRNFSILKFRSMTTDAERAGAAVWAKIADSRVTRVGKFIRLTRIDEIPQAINILCGHMAFVGPRPGLTGWAQVNYPYGSSIEDARNKLTYDLWYIQQRSLWLDMRIILATVRVVLRQAGAR
jgi:lipopolysaccharide/colanic/teichoic acid biosynthesis glycosyltransferase